MDTPEFREVSVSISMSKSVFLEVPNGMTKDQLIEKAKSEIFTPHHAIMLLSTMLNGGRGHVTQSDLADWFVDELEYIIDGFDNSGQGDSETSAGEQCDA